MKRLFFLIKGILFLIITILGFLYLDKKHPDKHIVLEDIVNNKY